MIVGDNVCQHPEKYRTKSKAGAVAEIPKNMPIITNRCLQYAISLNPNGHGYLQPLKPDQDLQVVNGTIRFKGLPATTATLKEIYRNTGLEEFNLSFLRMMYGIILKRFEETYQIGQQEEIITIYFPDFAKRIGKSPNTSKGDRRALQENIGAFHNVAGVTETGSVLPVLLFLGYFAETDTFKICSPYLNYVIEQVYKKSIYKNRAGKEMLKSNGLPVTKAGHSYAIKSEITKERNHRAVEIVVIIVTVIEQAGNGTPHISAKTIIERNPALLESINNTASVSDKNKKLNRAFTKAFELLRSCTCLKEKYRDIKLPDPEATDFRKKYIPTMSKLDLVYTFSHKGKIKDTKS